MPERVKPNPQAQEVFQIYAFHVARGNAAVNRRMLKDFSATEAQSQQMLKRLPGLIRQSEASDFYKQRLLSELFDTEGNYNRNNGVPYMDAAGWYFGVYQTPDGIIPGIFDKDGAQFLETNRMLFEAEILQGQFMRYGKDSLTLQERLPQEKEEFKAWADSYKENYDESITSVGDRLVVYMQQEQNPNVERVQQQVATLKAILGVYTDKVQSEDNS